MPITRGNRKLGRSIYHWSIPANDVICFMATVLCSLACYARRGHYRQTNVKDALEANYQIARQPGFISYIVEQIRKHVVWIFRIHASGEFFNARYVRNWVGIIRRCPRTVFFAYTRAWRDPDMLPALTALAALPNMRLWLSCDRETGEPPHIPFTRRAYMQVDHDDIPAFAVDLVFRVKTDVVAKKVAGVLVCPAENAVTETTCEKCGLCFAKQHHLDRINDYQRNDSLAIVS